MSEISPMELNEKIRNEHSMKHYDGYPVNKYMIILSGLPDAYKILRELYKDNIIGFDADTINLNIVGYYDPEIVNVIGCDNYEIENINNDRHMKFPITMLTNAFDHKEYRTVEWLYYHGCDWHFPVNDYGLSSVNPDFIEYFDFTGIEFLSDYQKTLEKKLFKNIKSWEDLYYIAGANIYGCLNLNLTGVEHGISTHIKSRNQFFLINKYLMYTDYSTNWSFDGNTEVIKGMIPKIWAEPLAKFLKSKDIFYSMWIVGSDCTLFDQHFIDGIIKTIIVKRNNKNITFESELKLTTKREMKPDYIEELNQLDSNQMVTVFIENPDPSTRDFTLRSNRGYFKLTEILLDFIRMYREKLVKEPRPNLDIATDLAKYKLLLKGIWRFPDNVLDKEISRIINLENMPKDITL